jgi:DNA-binding transcriptional MerR regulator
MVPKYLRTSDIAAAVGVHPNTVRLYEKWGFLPPIPRSAGGYRLLSKAHLEQMRLARLALGAPWPERNIRGSALELVRRAASSDLGGALERAYRHVALIQAERAQAEAAAELLKQRADGAPTDATARPLLIGETVRLLGLTADALRNWERDATPRITAQLLNSLPVADLAVEDPPLEAVIDQVYKEGSV